MGENMKINDYNSNPDNIIKGIKKFNAKGVFIIISSYATHSYTENRIYKEFYHVSAYSEVSLCNSLFFHSGVYERITENILEK